MSPKIDKTKPITCTLTSLIGRNLTGIKAQIRNPIYISEEMPAQWRILDKIITYKKNNKMWVELYWIKEADDSCAFTGCTQESDSVKVQFMHGEFSKMLKQS